VLILFVLALLDWRDTRSDYEPEGINGAVSERL
jgi:hypothetical protein